MDLLRKVDERIPIISAHSDKKFLFLILITFISISHVLIITLRFSFRSAIMLNIDNRFSCY